MNCHDFELRLYDEDCRRALLGNAPMPQDMADHVAGCALCREEWGDAAHDTVRLARELRFEPPPSIVALPLPGPTPLQSLSGIVGWTELAWALSAGALAAALGIVLPGAEPTWQMAGFWTGAAAGLAAAMLARNAPDLLPTGISMWI